MQEPLVYQLYFTKTALKDIKKLDAITIKRIRAKLDYFTSQPNPLALAKQLQNHTDAQYRYRIGNYRILFDVDGDKIVVLRIDKRSDIYRMFVL